MNRLLPLLILGLLISACSKKQKQLDNERLILGDWVKVKKFHKYDPNKIPLEIPDLPDFYTPGFTFYSNHTFDNKLGYFKDGYSVRYVYLGTISKYKITRDNLMLYRPDSNKWCNYKILKLTSDTLQFNFEGRTTTFKHYRLKENHTPEFDKIVISTSGCFGSCPISNTLISTDGNLVFKGQRHNRRLFTGKISKEQFKQLQDNFRKTNFDSLKNRYRAGRTDDETTTTTFVKNGKIYKSVSDYGRTAPYLFTWAYLPLQYFYQTIPLKSSPYNGPVADLDSIFYSSLKKGKMELTFKKSETFLLINYLRTGKLAFNAFQSRFKLHVEYYLGTASYDVDTDGRFFRFLAKGKPVTIDIGFNFYDVNAKNWQWRKAGEYE